MFTDFINSRVLCKNDRVLYGKLPKAPANNATKQKAIVFILARCDCAINSTDRHFLYTF